MTKAEIEQDISNRFDRRIGFMSRNDVAEYLGRAPRSQCISKLLHDVPRFCGRGYAIADVAEAIFNNMK